MLIIVPFFKWLLWTIKKHKSNEQIIWHEAAFQSSMQNLSLSVYCVFYRVYFLLWQIIVIPPVFVTWQSVLAEVARAYIANHLNKVYSYIALYNSDVGSNQLFLQNPNCYSAAVSLLYVFLLVSMNIHYGSVFISLGYCCSVHYRGRSRLIFWESLVGKGEIKAKMLQLIKTSKRSQLKSNIGELQTERSML